MKQHRHAGNATDARPLREKLRGVVLPEISRLRDLADHTGLPESWFLVELESGRLAGLRLVNEWLVHKRAVERWLTDRAQSAQEVGDGE
jgi:hypothetical protein